MLAGQLEEDFRELVEAELEELTERQEELEHTLGCTAAAEGPQR